MTVSSRHLLCMAFFCVKNWFLALCFFTFPINEMKVRTNHMNLAQSGGYTELERMFMKWLVNTVKYTLDEEAFPK